MNPGGYYIEESPQGRDLVVTTGWSREAEGALARGDADGLVLNYARGFSATNLEFLESILGIRRLRLLHRGIPDLGPITRLARSLEELSIQAYQDAEVDLTQLPKLTSLAGPWSVFRSTFAGSERLKRLITWAFDESDMRVLRNTFTLEDVTIKDAPHVESLTGIGDLPALEALRVIVARSLRDIRDVARLAGSLRELIFEGCPGVGDLEPLRSLVRLRVLGVSDCGYIESLGPIRPLNQLEQFSGWGSTRVVDGDLSPLAALPLLSEVRMRDRKGYSPHVRDLASAVF